MTPYDVAIIGAGVVGAFHAYFACRHGLRTLLLERGHLPGQASVRNFGMIIPSGLAPGEWHRRGLESAAVYRELADRFPFPIHRHGTQYLATTPAELHVLEDLAHGGPEQGYHASLLDPRDSVDLNPAIDPASCLASLHFPEDLRLEPRAFFRAFLPWMEGQLGCDYRPGTVAVGVSLEGGTCRIDTTSDDRFLASHVFICNGSDLLTLFPDRFAAASLTHCKLQMVRLNPPGAVRMTTSLASGLSLRRYPSFRLSPRWSDLQHEPIDPEYTRRGIHVLLTQDEDGRIVVGDSHEYTTRDVDDTLDAHTETLILQEARRLARLPQWEVSERWAGVYTLSEHEMFSETIEGKIHLLTGLGGKGMTTGPALARERIDRLLAGQ